MQLASLRLDFLSTTLGLLALQAAISCGQPPPPAPAGAAAATGTVSGEDVLTRGPLHDAFAAPVNLSGAMPPIVPKRPPAPIDEAPSDYRPQTQGAVWIPGYWDWDDERGDFLWISGIWRDPPPGRQWVAGYWTPAAGGFQRTPGFWAPADTDAVQYYPRPPVPPEEGPATVTPSADAFWSPGCYAWQGAQFVWSSGFWSAGQPGWVWVPTCYSWTPRGYVLVGGYWDYTLDQRGLAFAPVAFSPVVYSRPGFVYTPTVVIDPGIFTFYLFARPSWCHYYFGDYFAAKFDRLGFFPWYRVGRGAFRYDPLFAYDCWFYAGRDPHWIENLDRWHSYYRAHPEARPPHDLAEQVKIAALHTTRADNRYLTIAQPISKVVHNPDFAVRVTRLTAAERATALNVVHSHREFQTQRSRVETATVRTPGPGKATLPHSPHVIADVRTTPHVAGHDAVHFSPSERPGYTPLPPNKELEVHKDPAKAPHPEIRKPEPHPQLVPRHPPAPNSAPATHERPEHNPPPAQHGEREKKPG